MELLLSAGLLFALAFAGGAALGSFGGVVVARVPLGRSVVSPRSSCDSCGHTIRGIDNLPLVSWLLLGGRCRDCTARIPMSVWLIEAASGFGAVVALALYGPTERALYTAVGCWLMVVVATCDLQTMRIPNAINAAGFVGVVIWCGALTFTGGAVDWVGVLAGAALCSAFMFVFAIRGGIGMGDVKFAAVLGAMLGRFGVAHAIAGLGVGLIGGGLVAIIGLSVGALRKGQRVAYGPYLALGGAVALLFSDAIVSAWLGV